MIIPTTHESDVISKNNEAGSNKNVTAFLVFKR